MDPIFPVNIDNHGIKVDKNGRMTVHWKDEDTNQDHTFKLYFKKASADGGPVRTLRTTLDGLATADEDGNDITFLKSGEPSIHFIIKDDLVRRKDGSHLRKTWMKSLGLEYNELENEASSSSVVESIVSTTSAQPPWIFKFLYVAQQCSYWTCIKFRNQLL